MCCSAQMMMMMMVTTFKPQANQSMAVLSLSPCLRGKTSAAERLSGQLRSLLTLQLVKSCSVRLNAKACRGWVMRRSRRSAQLVWLGGWHGSSVVACFTSIVVERGGIQACRIERPAMQALLWLRCMRGHLSHMHTCMPPKHQQVTRCCWHCRRGQPAATPAQAASRSRSPSALRTSAHPDSIKTSPSAEHGHPGPPTPASLSPSGPAHSISRSTPQTCQQALTCSPCQLQSPHLSASVPQAAAAAEQARRAARPMHAPCHHASPTRQRSAARSKSTPSSTWSLRPQEPAGWLCSEAQKRYLPQPRLQQGQWTSSA